MSNATPPRGIDVSVVIPVFNEAEHIEQELTRIRRALDATAHAYEVIVVDDGSTDGSTEILRRINGIRLIALPHNRGSGTARRVGTSEANGEIIVWTDADMTYPNDEIPNLIKELEGFDQVVGARRVEQGETKLLRVPAKWIIRKIASYLTETDIPDLNSGYRAFRRSVALQFVHLLPTGFSCVTTMTMCFLGHGYSVKYVLVDYFPRSGKSKFHWWRGTQQYLLQVFRLVMSYEPLRIFVPLALGLTMLAVGKLTYDLVAHPWRVATNTIIIFFAAFQMFAIGLIADVVVRANRRGDYVRPTSL